MGGERRPCLRRLRTGGPPPSEAMGGPTGMPRPAWSVPALRPGATVAPRGRAHSRRPDPPTTYGGFKVMVERLLLGRHASTGFPATVVRPAAIYGPNNNIYDMEAAMFLRLLQRRPILVPHDGLVVNSYGHVDDLVD